MLIPWPCVDAGDLEPVVPGAGVGPLALGASADPVSVGLAILPAAAVRASVVEVEAAPVDLGLDRRGARSPRGGPRGRRSRLLHHALSHAHSHTHAVSANHSFTLCWLRYSARPPLHSAWQLPAHSSPADDYFCRDSAGRRWLLEQHCTDDHPLSWPSHLNPLSTPLPPTDTASHLCCLGILCTHANLLIVDFWPFVWILFIWRYDNIPADDFRFW